MLSPPVPGDILPERMTVFPDAIHLIPTGPIDAAVRVPGSKSITNRALVLTALADGRSLLEGALVAEDSEVMIGALRELGFSIGVEGTTFTVDGAGGRIPEQRAELDLRLSGTSIRFLTALVGLGRGHYRLDGNDRMRQRPIQDLVDALRSLGVKAGTPFDTGCPPVVVESKGLPGGEAFIAGDRSSQYLSALLMVAPYAETPVTLNVTGELQSKPFVDLTLGLMEAFGVAVERDGYARFKVSPASYRSRRYRVEGDAMAAGYFWAAAAVTGGRVRVENLGRNSLQGDRRLVEVLEQMGCRVAWSPNSCELVGPPAGRLKGGRFDLNDMPDQAQTLAVLGLFADAPVQIDNVWNLRIKETDRLTALATELTKLGAHVEEGRDGIVVHPLQDRPDGVVIETYGDHRMAMAFAVAGLRLDLTLRDPSCVAKTYPRFFEDWAALAPPKV